ncbi:hypothetical protein O6B96_03395 [Campylobacter ureolyticus]|uniref:hypothetical protein n=1 Tax=Campylobacter ureolyticus TaxID=827 RepID=UPI0022B42EB1|nr:hypothetical protein [Campylobacter ureolyticus]MCZ6150102.1 hypothetical protein [Campylobacter ureolyticus]
MQELISKLDKNNFVEKFLENYLAPSFGAMSKSEIDILVFHLLEDSFNKLSNYEISNLLKISETKVKNLRVNAYLRYNQNEKQILKNIIKRLSDSISTKVDIKNNEVRFTLENPVEKRVMIAKIKELGENIDFSFNNEILKLDLLAFFTFLNNISDEYIFLNALKDNKNKNLKLQEFLGKNETFKEKIIKILNFVKENDTALAFVSETLNILLKRL